MEIKNISVSLAKRLGFFKRNKAQEQINESALELGNALGYPSVSGIQLGNSTANETVIRWKKANGRLCINPSDYGSPHIVIAGASGNGKSTLLKKMIYGLSKCGINILLLDSDSEHYDIIKRVNGRVANLSVSGINIFALDGLSAGERIQELSFLLSEVFGFGYLQESLLHSCMRYIYAKAGMRSLSQRTMENIPNFTALLNELKIFIANSRSNPEKARLLSMLGKLSSLETTTLSTENSGKGINGLFEGIVAIPLSGIHSPALKQILMHEILSRLYSHMHDLPITHKLSNYIIIDELDFIISDYDSKTGIIKKIIKEGRKYGIGLIVSTHMCSSLPKDMVENSSCLITFDSKDPGERHYIASVMAKGSSQIEKFLYREISSIGKYHFILSAPEFEMPVSAMIEQGEANAFSHIDYLINPPSSALKKPIDKRSAIKMGFTEERIKDLKESRALSSATHKGSEWLMLRNPSLSIEHELAVESISKFLSKSGIRNYIMDNSKGPDIVAYPYTNRIAVEYETGKKSAYATSRMLRKRVAEYGFVIVFVNESTYGFYKSAIEREGILVISIKEIENSDDVKKS